MSWSKLSVTTLNNTFNFRHFNWNEAYIKQTQSSLNFLLHAVFLFFPLLSPRLPH